MNCVAVSFTGVSSQREGSRATSVSVGDIREYMYFFQSRGGIPFFECKRYLTLCSQLQRQADIIRSKNAEINTQKRVLDGFFLPEAQSGRDAELGNRIAYLEEKLAAEEQESKRLRRKTVEQGEQLRVLNQTIKEIRVVHNSDVKRLQTENSELTKQCGMRCRQLEKDILHLGGDGRLQLLETEVNSLREKNNALSQQVDELTGNVSGPTHFELLFGMAKCMNSICNKQEVSFWM